MRVIVHLSKSYDWLPVPPDIVLTKEEIASDRVRVSGKGGYLMRCAKPGDTFTTFHLSEEQIVAKIIDEKTRPMGGRTLTRKEAIAFYVNEHVIPNEATRAWIKGFEVEDDGHEISEEKFKAQLGAHVDAGNIEASEVSPHLAAYLESGGRAEIEGHLARHFKVGKKEVQR